MPGYAATESISVPGWLLDGAPVAKGFREGAEAGAMEFDKNTSAFLHFMLPHACFPHVGLVVWQEVEIAVLTAGQLSYCN